MSRPRNPSISTTVGSLPPWPTSMVVGVIMVCTPLFERSQRTTVDRGRIVKILDSTTEAGCATLRVMRTYGQYCPIARGAEIFAERWTPLIIRNLYLGCENFSEIRAGAPGLSGTLLSQRLIQLERLGVVVSAPKPDGRGHHYELTSAGHDLLTVCQSLGEWGAR